ncbi:MAG: hypothetical protein WCK29_03665, partial [archaeon]
MVSASFGDGVTDQISTLQNNLTNIQKTTDQIRNDILQQEWTNLVSKSQYIGPVHNFFIANPAPFKLLFNEPYSFSLTFLLIVILWFFILILTKKITKEFFKSSWKSWIFGLALAMILAWATVLKSVASFLLQIVFTQQYGWMRLLLAVIFFIALMLIYYLDSMIAKNIKKSQENKEKEELKEKTEENSAFIRGAKRGLKS